MRKRRYPSTLPPKRFVLVHSLSPYFFSSRRDNLRRSANFSRKFSYFTDCERKIFLAFFPTTYNRKLRRIFFHFLISRTLSCPNKRKKLSGYTLIYNFYTFTSSRARIVSHFYQPLTHQKKKGRT